MPPLSLTVPSSMAFYSEEKSKISVAEDGRFVHVGLDEISLRKYLNDSMFISSGD